LAPPQVLSGCLDAAAVPCSHPGHVHAASLLVPDCRFKSTLRRPAGRGQVPGMPQGVATTRNHLRRFAVLIGMQDNTVQLRETRHAFDSVAADYDGPRGNNALIQRMRRTLWEVVHRELPSGSRLLDLGERKSVGWGKSGSVRVGTGGRR